MDLDDWDFDEKWQWGIFVNITNFEEHFAWTEKCIEKSDVLLVSLKCFLVQAECFFFDSYFMVLNGTIPYIYILHNLQSQKQQDKKFKTT